MPKVLKTLLDHPRGTIFLGFNAAMLMAAVQFGMLIAAGTQAGVGGFAEIAIGYTGIALAIVALIVGWAMWMGIFIFRHRDDLHLLPHHASTGWPGCVSHRK